LHGSGLAIGKALTAGKNLDVAGDALMNNLQVDQILSVPGELTTSTTIELTDDAGINATGEIITTKFIQFGKYTTTERNALSLDSPPDNGIVIYNTTDHKFQGFANGNWVDFH
jgi:hypothetical protein